jgi:ABC-2 type transport system ATP-binding protein
VTIGDTDPLTDPYASHRIVGWMPDFFGVYEALTAREYLELFGAAFKLPRESAVARSTELLELVDLMAFADKPVHTMSRGQKQRLGFARTLVHEPTVLLLDEPASGLDPRARLDLRDLIRAQSAAGVTVLISSHILTELEEMIDAVVFVEAGRSRGSYALDDLPTAGRLRWRFRALDRASLESSLNERQVSLRSLPDGSIEVDVGDTAEVAELIERLVAAGVRLVEAAQVGGGLEGAFMAMEGSR